MRVISGTARGRKLKEPSGSEIRPTTDKVKAAAFNIVQFDVEGRRVLDLFAGTGQMGLEALSRGASSAVFLDRSTDAIRLVKQNLETCGFSDRAQVIHGDSVGYLSRSDAFDLIFVDPPYDTDLLDQALSAIIQFDILRRNGIILCESRVDRRINDVPLPYRIVKQYRYGQVKLTLITRGAE
jgi:16S rRNA (guanine(966)-N(2))-methyltransferase RsmD